MKKYKCKVEFSVYVKWKDEINHFDANGGYVETWAKNENDARYDAIICIINDYKEPKGEYKVLSINIVSVEENHMRNQHGF